MYIIYCILILHIRYYKINVFLLPTCNWVAEQMVKCLDDLFGIGIQVRGLITYNNHSATIKTSSFTLRHQSRQMYSSLLCIFQKIPVTTFCIYS